MFVNFQYFQKITLVIWLLSAKKNWLKIIENIVLSKNTDSSISVTMAPVIRTSLDRPKRKELFLSYFFIYAFSNSNLGSKISRTAYWGSQSHSHPTKQIPSHFNIYNTPWKHLHLAFILLYFHLAPFYDYPLTSADTSINNLLS